MPEFLHKIHIIEDSDGVTHEVVPLGLQNNGYMATLPTLSADATIALKSDVSTELFWVTYGTTTYEQITDAVSAGKLPVIKYNGITYTYSKDWGSSLGHVFGTMDANFDRWVYCKQNNTWGTGYMEVENSVNKTNALTSSSTVTQYPNAKVVYDTFQLYAKTTDIPTVNNATLTIQTNGTTVKTFTANASTDVTANITVPTTLDEIGDGESRKLADYLKKTETAADSDKLDGHDSTYFQTALSTQTAYSAKGGATKVPQITTNSLGQVTSITEVAITDNNDNQTVKVGSTTFTASAAVSFIGSGSASVSADNSSNTITITVPSIGTAASKNYTTTVASGNNDLVTSAAVYNAIDALPDPMIFKGTLGTNGTITSLPTASSSNTGFTYKVITDGTYAGQAAKVGDVFTSNGSSWVLIPSGDETDSDTWREIKVNGTSFLGSGISSGAVNFTHGDNVTISTGSNGAITIAATDTTYGEASAGAAGLMSTTMYSKLAGIATGAEVNVQSDWSVSDASSDAYIQNKPYLGQQIIVLEDNNSRTAGTWLAKTNAITALAAGQVFLYKVHVAGASTTTLNITCSGTAAGAKRIYRYGTTKLTTQYAVDEYVLLCFDGTYFRALNDYDANTDTKVRQYQKGGTGTLTGNNFPLLAKYVNTATTTYVASYANYWNDTYLNTDTGDLYMNGNKVATEDYVDAALAEDVTYTALKQLRDNSQLMPGKMYRITDYQCTTVQSNTTSAAHQFDIIVKATTANTLSEHAWAALHAGDTYFAACKLEAWQIWYCLDNDANRFAWADATNGKGVIYRMIDEFNNDCPYDFKNIKFTSSGKYTRAYTFSYTENSTVKDASLLGFSKSCYNNVMKTYIYSQKQALNFNVFFASNTTFSCCYNTFGSNCVGNTFGLNCYGNTFGNNCYSNIFDNNCHDNIFDDRCNNNTFGYSCNHITFGSHCYSNTLGHDCMVITFNTGCYYNTLGTASSPANYCQYILLDNACRYLYINSDTSGSLTSLLQKIHIHLGVSGSSTSDRKTITVDRNLTYTTDVYPTGSTEIFV